MGPGGGDVTALALDPRSRTLYAAGPVLTFQSADGGRHWDTIDPPSDSTLARIGRHWKLASPLPGFTLVVHPGSGAVYKLGGRELRKSIDGGMTFAKGNSLPTTGNISAIVLDPRVRGTLYVALRGVPGRSGVSENGRIWKTTDDGATWSNVAQSLGSFLRPSVAVDPRAAGTVYAAVGGPNVFVSQDGGRTWHPGGGFPVEFAQFVRINTLAIDPMHAGGLYAGTSQGVFRSEDGGVSWLPAASELPGEVEVLLVDSRRPRTLYAGTACHGVFKSVDRGRTWRETNTGLNGSWPTSMAVGGGTLQGLHVGTGCGLFASDNRGASWNRVREGLPDGFFGSLVAAGSGSADLYAFVESAAVSGFFRTMDGGTTWTAIAGVPRLTYPARLAPDPRVPGRLFTITTGGAYRSDDGGDGWSPLSSLDAAVSSLALDPVTPGLMYAAAHSVFYKSADAGSTWQQISTALPPLFVTTDIAIDPVVPSTLYVASSSDGILRSTDGGATWHGPPNNSLGRATLLGVDSGTQSVYASSYAGVFQSPDGVTWTPVTLPAAGTPWTLSLGEGSPNVLYAGFPNVGVFAMPLCGNEGYRTAICEVEALSQEPACGLARSRITHRISGKVAAVRRLLEEAARSHDARALLARTRERLESVKSIRSRGVVPACRTALRRRVDYVIDALRTLARG